MKCSMTTIVHLPCANYIPSSIRRFMTVGLLFKKYSVICLCATMVNFKVVYVE